MKVQNQIPTARTSKATVYVQGLFGYSTIEVADLDVKVAPYAQYRHAVHLEYRKKRARHRVRHTLPAYRTSAVIVEGWGHPTFNNFSDPEETSGGVVVKAGLHTSCSPEWQSTFRKFLTSNGLTPLVDFHGWNAHTGSWPLDTAA